MNTILELWNGLLNYQESKKENVEINAKNDKEEQVYQAFWNSLSDKQKIIS